MYPHSHNAHEIQLDVFFRFTFWLSQSGAWGSNDENISSPDLLFPFWKSVKEDGGARELICNKLEHICVMFKQ